MQGIFDGFAHTALTLAIACRHDGHATVFQHSLYIVEVQVDKTMNGDDFRNRLRGHRQRVIGLSEGIEYGQLRIDFAKALIVDDQQGVHMLRHLLYAVEGLIDFLRSFEAEGDGDNADGQDTEFF